MVTQYREQSSPTNVDWVPFQELKPQLDEFVVCSLSCSEHLSSGTPVFLPPQKTTLQFYFDLERTDTFTPAPEAL